MENDKGYIYYYATFCNSCNKALVKCGRTQARTNERVSMDGLFVPPEILLRAKDAAYALAKAADECSSVAHRMIIFIGYFEHPEHVHAEGHMHHLWRGVRVASEVFSVSADDMCNMIGEVRSAGLYFQLSQQGVEACRRQLKIILTKEPVAKVRTRGPNRTARPPGVMNRHEVARLLRVSPSGVNRLVRDGMPMWKTEGGHARFIKSAVMTWLSETKETRARAAVESLPSHLS